jgi:hypothetical protein
MNGSTSTIGFVVFSGAILIGLGGYLAGGPRSAHNATDSLRPIVHEIGSTVADAGLAAIRERSHVVFRNMEAGPRHGMLAAVGLDDPNGVRRSTNLSCARVYAVARRTFCLAVQNDPVRPLRTYTLDETWTVRQALGTFGVPSRTRVSADGRYAAYTVFVQGDSYSLGLFSTRTKMVRTDTGRPFDDLENFTATKNGVAFSAADFNYWGVTFKRDAGHFYATLSTGGKTFLVDGDIERRTVAVVRDGIECPSLSPDESRIAFKKKRADGTWQPAILDLRSQREVLIPEPGNLDDQIEWLDRDRILYAIGRPSAAPDVWEASADGRGAPRLFLANAESPAVVMR